MTQARNYAAKASRDIKRHYLTPETKRLLGEEEFILLRYIHHMLSKAVHFTLPDGGKLFDDNLKGLRGQEIHLPYPAITVETNLKVETNQSKIETLTLAIEGSKSLRDYAHKCGWEKDENLPVLFDTLFIYGFYHHPSTRKQWMLMPVAYKISRDWDGGDKNGNSYFKAECFDVIDWEVRAEAIKKKRTIEDQREEFAHSLTAMTRPMFELCEALSCSNVETDTIQQASKRNVKRLRQGKLPLFETKTLVINTQYQVKGQATGGGGKHSSPRQHLRRGHIRFLQSDRFKNKQGQKIWVNSTVVGGEGKIEKNYEVR